MVKRAQHSTRIAIPVLSFILLLHYRVYAADEDSLGLLHYNYGTFIA